MTWLVTGGAGYIGAFVVKLLLERGDRVIVFDDLSTGERVRVGDAELVVGTLLDTELLARTFTERSIDGVVHFAAKKQVGESMEQPLLYYRENVGGMESLLRAMVASGVERIVYSSSAATYGIPNRPTIDEDEPLRPINPYGETKVIGEWMLAAAARAHGLRYAALRYFNVAGAADGGTLGDPGVFNLIPLVFQAIRRGEQPQIFGTDYDTADGTCIRDYVHVVDLAEAHLVAADTLTNQVFNVGTGHGFSVREVIAAVERATGRTLEPVDAGRRAGDPPALVANVDRIAHVLGWSAKRTTIDEIVGSAWKAYAHRHGL